MANIKVRGGTAYGSDPLCLTCSYRVIVRGFNNESFNGCSSVSFTRYGDAVPFPVYECSSYKSAKQATLREMKELAWIVRTDSSGKRIGFARMRDLDPEEQIKVQREIREDVDRYDDY